MSKVLITGGQGYIGSHAVFAFLDAGYEVSVVDNYAADVRVAFPEAVSIHEGDCGDRAFIQNLLHKLKPEAVLHFAGSIIVPESVRAPSKYYRNNTLASLNLIGACIDEGVENFVFSSTAAVYGIPDGGLAKENGRTEPINPYGRSKLMVEQMLADIAAAHQFRYVALRYFNVAGADPKGRAGQSGQQATHLVKVACEVAAGVRPQMEIYGTDYNTPDGTCLRDYIHVSDLAQAHLVALRYIQEKKRSAIFNCGIGKGYSVREVMKAVEEVAGVALNVVEAPRRAGDPPQLVADPSLLKQETNWQAQWTQMTDIVRHALQWEKKLKQKS